MKAFGLPGGHPQTRRSAASLALASLLCVSACTQGAVVRGRIGGLTQDVDNAEKNGAMRCAPRELALAKSHLRFAAVKLDQGDLAGAEHDLVIAEPNAHAALSQSPPDRCAERRFVEAKTDEDPDTDGDRVPDSKDQCVLAPEDKDGYLDDDGCPDPDNDLDTIPDGRRRRAQDSRQRIVAAMIELVAEGHITPSAEEVASDRKSVV